MNHFFIFFSFEQQCLERGGEGIRSIFRVFPLHSLIDQVQFGNLISRSSKTPIHFHLGDKFNSNDEFLSRTIR